MRWYIPAVEQVGTYDPYANVNGEKLVSLNIERIQHYLSQGVQVDTRVAQLLGKFCGYDLLCSLQSYLRTGFKLTLLPTPGLAGLLPQHPSTYQSAWRNRRELTRLEMEKQSQSKQEEAVKS